MLELNKIHQGDCMELMKQIPDNSIDAIVTDPPYFLINESGGGFMSKTWDSLNSSGIYDIVWKSEEFAKNVERFFLLLKTELNLEEEFSVQETVNIHSKRIIELKPNARSVEKKSLHTEHKLKANTDFVQGIVLTKQEVLDMCKELLKSPMYAIESQKEDALFVIPYFLMENQIKNTAQENALNNLKKRECKGKITHLSLMEEARIKGLIEAMIGKKLENKFIQEMDGNVEYVENIAIKRKYRHITLLGTEKKNIMEWITSLLFATNVIQKSKAKMQNFLMYQFTLNWSTEAFRILKHGGHLLSFGGTRTYHRMTCAIEDAGFEIRDCIIWCYGSGFPKSLNVGKAMDKMLGNERKVIGDKQKSGMSRFNKYRYNKYTDYPNEDKITKGNTKWEGWGTALKPALEPIVMARKPLGEKTVTKNVLKWGTGGLNIDECRIPTNENRNRQQKDSPLPSKYGFNNNSMGNRFVELNPQGRFPANFIHDGSPEVVRMFPECKSTRSARGGARNNGTTVYQKMSQNREMNYECGFTDSGSASRFFYCAKAGREDRDFGLTETKNTHPTVKPLRLMRYLCRLVTPPNGIVLDPFAGTGSTCISARQEGFRFIGMEKEHQYCKIANRIVEVLKQKNLLEV